MGSYHATSHYLYLLLITLEVAAHTYNTNNTHNTHTANTDTTHTCMHLTAQAKAILRNQVCSWCKTCKNVYDIMAALVFLDISIVIQQEI